MPRTRTAYPLEFRDQIVALARAGRSIKDLAKEFEPCADSIRNWVRAAETAESRTLNPVPAGLDSDEREELRRLRREVKQLRQERDILSKAAAWFAQNDVTSSKSSNS